jgi:K+ transporter
MLSDYFTMPGIVKSMGLVFGDIGTSHALWRIFSAIKHLTPSVVQCYKLPSDKIHGVVNRVEM